MGKKLIFIVGFFFIIIVITIFIPRAENISADFDDTQSVITEKTLFDDEVIIPYDSLLQNFISNDSLVGLASAIVTGNKIKYIKSYGVQSIDTKILVNDSTLFRLASLSKGFTGILAGILDAKGIISLDEKVIHYLPEFHLKNDSNTLNLTIRHILSHTSGVIPHAYDNLVEEDIPFSDIVTNLSEVEISSPPGEVYSYQNVMFSIYDSIVKVATGKSFNDLMDEKIFSPLHMNYSFVGEPAAEEKLNFAMPHRKIKGGFMVRQFNENYYNVNPAAGVNASISDMSKWLIALIGNNPDVIPTNVLSKVFEPQIITPLPRRYFPYWENIQTKEYAIGWRIITQNNKKLIYHGGYVNGYKSEIAIFPEKEIGIVFLTNSPSKEANICFPFFWDLIDKYLEKNKQIVLN